MRARRVAASWASAGSSGLAARARRSAMCPDRDSGASTGSTGTMSSSLRVPARRATRSNNTEGAASSERTAPACTMLRERVTAATKRRYSSSSTERRAWRVESMSSSRPSSPTATRPAPTSARRSARRIRSRRRRFGQAPSCRPARTTTCQWRPIACAGVRTSTPPGRTPTREIVSMGTEPASSSDAKPTAEPAGFRCSHTSATRRRATTASS